MVAFSPLLAFYLLLIPAALAAGAGVLTGWATSHLVGTKAHAWAVNAFLAGVSFVGALFGALSLPWHGTFVRDGWTMSHQFPYPFVAAYAVAITLTVVHEFYRARQSAT